MRILILSQYYHPEPVPKPHELAVGLADLGHSVQVLTGYPNYPVGRRYPGHPLRPWTRERIDGIHVLRVPVFADHSKRAVLRVLNVLSFGAAASVLGPALVRKPDVVYVFHPPLTMGIPAFLLSRLRGAPVLYALHDLWPEAVEASGMLRNGALLGGLRRLERWVYARMDRLAVISDGFRDNLIGKGVPPEKIELLPHWADEGLFRPEPRNPALASELGLGDEFLVLFAGNLGRIQGLDSVLDAAALLRDDPGLVIGLMGGGVERQRLQRRAGEEGLSNVRFLPPQPPERMSAVSALADAMLVTLARNEALNLTIPSKVFTALACARPVLVSADGEPAALIRRLGAGLVVAPEDPEALAGAIRRLRAMSTPERAAMGQRGRTAFEAEFAKTDLVRRHAEILRELAAGPGAPDRQRTIPEAGNVGHVAGSRPGAAPGADNMCG